MDESAFDRLRSMSTPISRYQQQFTEHAIPSGVLKMAADTGKIPLLKEMAQEAVNSGCPILDWNDFIPVYARTSNKDACTE